MSDTKQFSTFSSMYSSVFTKVEDILKSKSKPKLKILEQAKRGKHEDSFWRSEISKSLFSSLNNPRSHLSFLTPQAQVSRCLGQIRNLSFGSQMLGKRSELTWYAVNKVRKVKETFMPSWKAMAKEEKKADEQLTMTPRTISLQPNKKKFASIITKKVKIAKKPPREVTLSSTQKVVASKAAKLTSAQKLQRITQENLIPQMYPRTSLQMKKTFLPLEPCLQKPDKKTPKQMKTAKLSPSQRSGIFKTVKTILKNLKRA